MMQPRQKKNNPTEGARRAHAVLTHATHVMALVRHRKTELEEYQRRFVREALKRAVDEIGCLLEGAWLEVGVTPWGRGVLRFHAPMALREASSGVSSPRPPSSATG
jgi:hypothetical protein